MDTSIDFAAQARELDTELDAAERAMDEMRFGETGARTEHAMRLALKTCRENATLMRELMAGDPDDEHVRRLQRSIYGMTTEWREWREDMEMVMERVPALRKGGGS